MLTGDKRELRLLSQEFRLKWMDECSDQLWRTLGSCAQASHSFSLFFYVPDRLMVIGPSIDTHGSRCAAHVVYR